MIYILYHMGYKGYSTPQSDFEDSGDLVWDLRQFYALYVSRYLARFDSFKEDRDYRGMLDQLIWLFATVQQKVKKFYDDEKFIVDKDKILEVANKHVHVWNRSSNDAEGMGKIEQSFLDCYSNLMKAMIRGGIFGKSEDLTGL